MKPMITILGPTASGKTPLAAALAKEIGGEIISADSRQVYRRMDIGTGKDLEDYGDVKYHLIDIAEPGTKYNLFKYQHDFYKAFCAITEAGHRPILCGGTGLYIEAVLKGYQLSPVPQNPELRAQLEGKSLEELTQMLIALKAKNGSNMHNKTDVDSCQRAIRAIEIETAVAELRGCGGTEVRGHENSLSTDSHLVPPYHRTTVPPHHRTTAPPYHRTTVPPTDSIIIGVDINREERRRKITSRLKARLENGMIEEVKALLDEGIPAEDLIYYGLEYKFVTEYLIGKTTYDEMFTRLEIAIHQFAKRQMTWFRGMERRGFTIHWIDALLPTDEKVARILEICEKTMNYEL